MTPRAAIVGGACLGLVIWLGSLGLLKGCGAPQMELPITEVWKNVGPR